MRSRSRALRDSDDGSSEDGSESALSSLSDSSHQPSENRKMNRMHSLQTSNSEQAKKNASRTKGQFYIHFMINQALVESCQTDQSNHPRNRRSMVKSLDKELYEDDIHEQFFQPSHLFVDSEVETEVDDDVQSIISAHVVSNNTKSSKSHRDSQYTEVIDDDDEEDEEEEEEEEEEDDDDEDLPRQSRRLRSTVKSSSTRSSKTSTPKRNSRSGRRTRNHLSEQISEEDEEDDDEEDDDDDDDDDDISPISKPRNRANLRSSMRSSKFNAKRSRILASSPSEDSSQEDLSDRSGKTTRLSSRGSRTAPARDNSPESRDTLPASRTRTTRRAFNKEPRNTGLTIRYAPEAKANGNSSDDESPGETPYGNSSGAVRGGSGDLNSNASNPSLNKAAIAFASYPAMPFSSAPALSAAVTATLNFAEGVGAPSAGARLNADVDTVRPAAGSALGGPASGANNSGAVTGGDSESLDFSQVGGLDAHLRSLHEMVVLPLLHPEIFQSHGIVPPRGVLFTGPPGTGKTLTARALAATCSRLSGREVSFFVRKGADCLSKWVGEAERQLRLLFAEARERQPSVIFFDEIDGLAPVRSARQDQAHASLVSTLLALMDGLDSRGQVIIIGATNRVDAIDPALRRPGRFDRELLFALPSPAGREQILKIHTRTWSSPPVGPLLRELVEKTPGYCGADLKSLCTEASLRCVRRKMPELYDLPKLGSGPSPSTPKVMPPRSLSSSPLTVTREDFLCALRDIVPASHRAVASPALPLPFPLNVLLDVELKKIIQAATAVFPLQSKKGKNESDSTRSQEGEGGGEVESKLGEHETEHPSFPLVSTAVKELCAKTFRPRLLIHGPAGLAQSTLASAVLREYENIPLYTLHLPSLLSDAAIGSGGLEAAIVTVINSARKNAPSVLFWPNVDRWWESVSSTTRSIILMSLLELPADSEVFVLGYSEEHFSVLPASIQSIFLGDRVIETLPDRDRERERERNQVLTGVSSENSSTSTLSLLPSYQQRFLYDLEASFKTGTLNHCGYFAPVISLLVAPRLRSSSKPVKDDNSNSVSLVSEPGSESEKIGSTSTSSTATTTTTAVVSVSQPQRLQSESAENSLMVQRTHDEVLLLHLRMFLRSVVSSLLRNYRDFIMIPEDDPTYSGRVSRPLFLLDILAKVNDTCYLSVREFLLDIDLLCANTQRAYSIATSHGRTLIARVCDLQDTALSLCLGLEKTTVLACEVMATRLRTEARLCGRDFTPWASLLFTPNPRYIHLPPLTVAEKVNKAITEQEMRQIQSITSKSEKGDNGPSLSDPSYSHSHFPHPTALTTSESDKKPTDKHTVSTETTHNDGTTGDLYTEESDNSKGDMKDDFMSSKTIPFASTVLSGFDQRVSLALQSSTTTDTTSSTSTALSLTSSNFEFPEIDIRLLKILLQGLELKVTKFYEIDQLENLFSILFTHAKRASQTMFKNDTLVSMVREIKQFLLSSTRQKRVLGTYTLDMTTQNQNQNQNQARQHEHKHKSEHHERVSSERSEKKISKFRDLPVIQTTSTENDDIDLDSNNPTSPASSPTSQLTKAERKALKRKRREAESLANAANQTSSTEEIGGGKEDIKRPKTYHDQ